MRIQLQCHLLLECRPLAIELVFAKAHCDPMSREQAHAAHVQKQSVQSYLADVLSQILWSLPSKDRSSTFLFVQQQTHASIPIGLSANKEQPLLWKESRDSLVAPHKDADR